MLISWAPGVILYTPICSDLVLVDFTTDYVLQSYVIALETDVIMRAMASEITGVSIACSIVCSSAVLRKHQSSASLAFMRGIQEWPVDFPHKGPVTRKMLPFHDVIMGNWTIIWLFIYKGVRFHGLNTSCPTSICIWSCHMRKRAVSISRHGRQIKDAQLVCCCSKIPMFMCRVIPESKYPIYS